jgi:tetratricopeptide (TPR) repeat protein
MKFFNGLVHRICMVLLLSSFTTTVSSQGSNVADSLLGHDQFTKAKSLYESLLKTTAVNDPLTYNKLGYCYHNLGDYAGAVKLYMKALELNLPPGAKWALYSRMARSYARLKDADRCFIALDSAFANGYSNALELEKLEDYNAMRKDARFKTFFDKVYAANYTCSTDLKSREFDFWMGEWDVYPTGGYRKSGHSLIQRTDGECTIVENWTSLNSPFSYTGKSLNFFNQATGTWQQYWHDSAKGYLFSDEGQYKDGAMRFKQKGKDKKGEFIANFIFYNMGPDRIRQYQEKSYDSGKTWQTSLDLTYIRIK